jgi:hypothetical protein
VGGFRSRCDKCPQEHVSTDPELTAGEDGAQDSTVLSAKLGSNPSPPEDPTSLSAEVLEEVETFLAAIDANDNVQSTCTSALAANSSIHDGDRRLTATIDT